MKSLLDKHMPFMGNLPKSIDPQQVERLVQDTLATAKLGAAGGEGSSPASGDWQRKLADTLRNVTGGATNGRAQGTAPLWSGAGPAAANGAGAAATSHDAPGRLLRGTHDTRFGQRAWRLYVPTRADSTDAGKLPLVVMLHGCTQGADDFARGTRMDTVGEANDCFVLYPEQDQGANPQRCWNWFKHTHQTAARGEPAILVDLVDHLAGEHGIDRRRTFVAGLSAGGAMAAILGDVAPDTFAAVGVHSGLAAGAASDLPSAMAAMQGRADAPSAGAHGNASGRRVPTIVFHGDRDGIVHPVNGERIAQACAAAGSGTVLRAEPKSTSSANGRTSDKLVWRTREGRPVAEHWSIQGAGHAWSGGDGAGSYADAQGPDASAEMMRFFLAQGE